MTILQSINEGISQLREEARREAKRNSEAPVIRSRGVALYGSKKRVNAIGYETEDIVNADFPRSIGSRLRKKDVDEFLADYPDTDAIDVEGGHDAHWTIEWDDNYEPWVSSWETRVWTKKDGLVFWPDYQYQQAV
mgnify:CR=1 FL=1